MAYEVEVNIILDGILLHKSIGPTNLWEDIKNVYLWLYKFSRKRVRVGASLLVGADQAPTNKRNRLKRNKVSV